MSKNLFKNLRLKTANTYAAIFGVLIIMIIALTYLFVWWSILDNEKSTLVAKTDHEIEEYLDTGEAPVSTSNIADGSMLAYVVAADKQGLLMDQLTGSEAGPTLLKHHDAWPDKDRSVRLVRLKTDEGARYRYLISVCPIVDKNQTIGYMYMFKNMQFYYTAAYRTLFQLFCVALVLFGACCYLGYWLAGKNVRPVAEMYAKQEQFTADASHEMRTPLTVLKLSVDALRSDTDSKYSEFAEDTFSMMEGEVDRLTRLTDSLMMLARNDAGLNLSEKKAVDFSKVLQRVADQLGMIASHENITLTSDIAEKVMLLGEQDKLNRLAIILIDNAVKYSHADSEIKVKLKSEKDTVIFEVADNGIGISSEDKKKIFDRFYRVDKARSRSKGGLGLGLSLAEIIVKEHKGRIEILDNKPCGTIFRILMPLYCEDK